MTSPLVPTIFHEPWWLDIASGNACEFVEVADKDGIIGRLHYFPKKKCGLTYCVLPGLIHTLAPVVDPGVGHKETQKEKAAKITRELIDKLPRADLYRFNMGTEDVIPFQQREFMTRVQFTHKIAPKAESEILEDFSRSKRKEIRRATGKLEMTKLNADEYFDFYDENIASKERQNAYGEDDRTLRLIEESIKRGCGKIYAARNVGDGRELAAAIFVVWDDKASYLIMGSRSKTAPEGAVSFLALEAIKDSVAAGRVFDFDGLSSKSGSDFFAGFGAQVYPRYIVIKTTMLGGILFGIKEHFRESRFFC